MSTPCGGLTAPSSAATSPALRELSHERIEVYAVTGLVAGGSQPYRGANGLADYMRDVEAVWDEIELTPQEFEQIDERTILVTGRVRVRRDRSRVDTPNAWLWEFEDDRVRRVRVLTDPDEVDAIRAGELSEASASAVLPGSLLPSRL